MPIPKKENKDNTNIKDGSVELKQPNNSKTLKTDEIKETISKKEANIVKEVYEFKDDNWQDESLLDTEVLKTKSTGERKISLGIYKKIAISFLVATLILAAFIVYLYLVKVSITIVPAKEKLNTNMIVSVLDTEKHKGLTKENSVIGVVKEIEITDSEEFESTGKKLIDNEIVGEVEIVNNYNKNQPLVASTRILSPDNKIFRIKNTVTVLAGKSVRVPIYTEKTDKEYAIGPTNFTIPGLWSGIQDKIYARSDSAFIYQENSKRFITNVDILNAKEKMKATIVDKAKKQVESMYSNYDKFIYKIKDDATKETVSAKALDELEKFNIETKTTVSVVAYNNAPILELAKTKIQGELKDNKTLDKIYSSNIEYNLDTYDINEGIASVNVFFTGDVALNKEGKIFEKEKIIGLTRNQLEDYLKGLPGIKSYDIKFNPSFIERVPNVIDRISIIVRE